MTSSSASHRSESYLELNRANWDERAAPHFESKDYAVDRFLADPEFLSAVVRFDLKRLPDIKGLDVIHLQCHLGTDTLSLARLGGNMTGLDFSGASLEKARELASKTGAKIDYVESDVYEAVDAVAGRKYDMVYTGIGALCWLPSIAKWASTVSGLLKPGGRLFIREGHPVLWALDEIDREKLVLLLPYFETAPMVWDEPYTYVETEKTLENQRTHQFNHGLGEIITALMKEEMVLELFEEHDTVPWPAFSGSMEPVKDMEGEWRLKENVSRLPASYTLIARKIQRDV